MNYSGKFDAKLPADGSGPHWSGHLETVSSQATHAPAGAIIVPDAQLLFNGDFKRSGLDLVLSKDDHELVLRDYFRGEKHATLSSPDGAHLTGNIVNALAGHVEYAQASGGSAGTVIGHVTKLTGTATATRNGVSIILNQGDNVEKGDVVQSGSNSTLGLTFIDGTVFGLSSNARMMLNEMVYDPNGSNNSSLLSLVAGTITFVAGETAKHGDMKVNTPVATMGIRGTAVLVEIEFKIPLVDPNLPPTDPNALPTPSPTATFQVLVEPDGTTGSYILFDPTTLLPLITVDKAGQYVSINNGNLTTGNALLSPDVQKLITDVFSMKFTSTDTNTKFAEHFTDTLTPQAFTPFVLANGTTAIPIFLNNPTLDKAAAPPPPGPPPPPPHIDQAPQGAATSKAFLETPQKTHNSTPDTVTGTINFTDINAGDLPTVSAKFDSFSYQNAAHQEIKSLSALQLADIAAVEAKLVVVPDAGNNNNGSATWTYSVPDSAFDFLAAGETLTLTYVALVDNNFTQDDAVTAVTFTIVITGTNDVPVITSGPLKITLSDNASTSEGPASTDPTSGTLAFADVDLTDTHTKVTTDLTDAVLSDGSAVSAASLAALKAALSALVSTDSTGTGTGVISWQLASLPVDFIPPGQTLTLTYTVTVTDSQNAVSAPQTITVTIVGIDHLVVTATAEAADEDGTSALTLAFANESSLFANSDESVTVTISLDHGAKLTQTGNGATVIDNHDGTFTVTAHSVADLTGLTITPASEFEGSVQVGVSAVAHVGTVESAVGSTSTSLTVNPVADVPVVSASAAAINEDGTSALTLTLANAAALFENSDDSVTITVTLDHGATLHGTGVVDNHDGTFTLTAHSVADLNGLTITPASEFEGSVTVGVSAVAHDGTSDSAVSVTSTSLTVNPLPETPVFTASAATIDEDGTSAVTISIANLAELTEDGTDSLTVKIFGLSNLSQNGEALTANEDGSFTLTVHSASDLTGLTTTPAASFEGSIPFSVSVTAHDGTVDSATVSHDATLTVNPLPETPVFTASAATIDEDGTSAVTISIANLAELTEDGTDSLTVKIFGLSNLSQNGEALTANQDGSFTLTVHSASDLTGLTTTPAASFEGSIPFSVSVTAHDGTVDSATVSHDATLTVNPLPETPVFTASAATIDEDGTSAVTISIANLAELTEDGSDSLTVKIFGLSNLSQNGEALTANQDGSFTLTVHSASDLTGLTTTPAASFEGSIPFSVSVTAHDGTVDSATVSHDATLTVNPLPETPVFTASAATIDEDGTSAVTISIANLAELTEDGTDSLTVKIFGLSNLSQNGEALTANQDGSFTLTVHSASDLTGLTTTPAASFEGSIPFSVSVTAHDGTVDSATVSHDATLTVNPLPETPVFTASAATIDEDGTSAVTISIANLAELTEDGTDSLTVKIFGLSNLSQNGEALTANQDGSFTLTVHSASDLTGLTTTPAASFEGSIPFSVSVTAHDGTVDSATVSHDATLTVNPLPETPVFTASAATIDEDGTSAVTISIANLAELTEDGSDSLTVKIFGLSNLSQNGEALTANQDGSFTLTVHSASDLTGLTTTPAASFEGSIPFSVSVTAHDGTVDSATVSHDATLTVNPLPETPVFTASAATIDEDGTSAVTISIANLAELTEDGTDSLTVKIFGLSNLSQNGEALTANQDGSFTLTVHSASDLTGLTTTPAASFEGSIPFSVSVTAHDGTVDSATVSHDATLTVNPLPETPVFTASAATIDEDGTSAVTISIANLAELTEDGSDSLTVKIFGLSNLSQNGEALTANQDGSFTLTVHSASDLTGLTTTPAASFEGSIPFSVSVTAHDGTVDSATVSHDATLTVNPLPETPVFTASAATIDEDGTSAVTISIANLAELTEDGSDSLTVKIFGLSNLSQNGEALTANEDGSFTLTVHSASDLTGLTTTPAASFEGSIPFSVSVTAHDGTVDSATVSHDATLTVNPLPETPVLTASAAATTEGNSSVLTLELTNAAELFEDSSDSVTIKISLNNGATLHGSGVIDNHDGTFTLTAHSIADLSGLTITPASEFEGTVTIGISAIANDGTVLSATATASTTLTVNPVADVPVVTVSAPAINENGTCALTLTLANAADLFENSDDSVTFTVTLNHGATLHGSGVIDNHNGTFTFTAHSVADLNGLTITPVNEFEGTVTVGISAVAHDGTAVSSAGTASTTFVVDTPNDLVATLSSSSVHDGVTIRVTGVKDGDTTVTTGLTYKWQESSNNGLTWTTVGTNSSFTPGESDEGKLMQLIVTYADANGSESTTVNLGMPNDLTATLDRTTAQQGVAIHVTSVNDGGTVVGNGVSYSWQVSSDQGQTWTSVGTNSSYTPVLADDGKLLQLVVTYVDSGEKESVTDSLGVVAPAKVWNGGSHDWQTASQWTSTGAPTSGDDVVIGISGTYTVSISQDAVAHSLIMTNAGATVEVLAGHTLTLAGDLTVNAGTFKVDAGATLKDIAAHATITGSLIDSGTVEASGGTLEVASTAVSGTGTFQIDAGATLQLDHADALNVTFAASSGTLSLLDPAHFTGKIAGITGNDVLDLHGFAAATTTAKTGAGSYNAITNITTLTVTDSASHLTETFKLTGNLSNSTWTVTDDHNGGVNIVDPPGTGANVGAVIAYDPGPADGHAANQGLAGFAAGDTFVFNFAGAGHTTATDLDSVTDALHFRGSIMLDALAALHATPDDGHGNTFLAVDANELNTQAGVIKAQLHSSDFHFV